MINNTTATGKPDTGIAAGGAVVVLGRDDNTASCDIPDNGLPGIVTLLEKVTGELL